MKQHLGVGTFFLIIFSFVLIALPQIPNTLSYQGVLKDAGGALVPNGDYSLTFNLYTAATGGTTLWSEVQTVSVIDGIFNVILGQITPLALPFDQPYWLGVTVGTGPELTPRISFTASAYSLNANRVVDNAITTAKIADEAVTLTKISSSGASAGDVLTYNGNNLTWQTPAGGGIGGSGTADYLPRFTGSNTLGNTSLLYNASWGGNLGFGDYANTQNTKFLVNYTYSIGSQPPQYLALFQTRTATIPVIYTDVAHIETDGDAFFRGNVTVGPNNESVIETDGDAYFSKSLKVGQNSISISEIIQLSGTTGSSAQTSVPLPSGWNYNNTRVISAEVYNSAGPNWNPIGTRNTDYFWYLMQTNTIILFQDTNTFTYIPYRFVLMRIN